MQLLEPVLHVAPRAVDLLVDRLGRVGQVGHEESRIALGIAPGIPHDLGLDDRPSLALPRPGRVARLAVEVLGPARGSGAYASLAQQAAGAFLQPRVALHVLEVLDRIGLQAGEPPWG